MGLCGTFRLTFGTQDFKYIIGTIPQELGRVVTLARDCTATSRTLLVMALFQQPLSCHLQRYVEEQCSSLDNSQLDLHDLR